MVGKCIALLVGQLASEELSNWQMEGMTGRVWDNLAPDVFTHPQYTLSMGDCQLTSLPTGRISA